MGPAQRRCDRKYVKDKIPVLGSQEEVLSNGNYGFFSTVIECYNNHWILDMRPEDWFYTFVQTLSVAIDKQARTEEVRNFFVSHEGKKTLSVTVPDDTSLTVNYDWFLDQMLQKIQENIKTPQYVELMTADFSTSTKNDRIISSINTMSSTQEFFNYMMYCGCGIPAVTMRGTEEDWKHLMLKLENLEKLLHPIQEQLRMVLHPNWWDNIKTITQKLVETYQGTPDLVWWHSIIVRTKEKKWGGASMGYMGKHKVYNGWFLSDILGIHDARDFSKIKNPLVTVPLTISSPFGEEEESAFIAGIVGYVVKTTDYQAWPSVAAVHSWTLCLENNSGCFNRMSG